MIVGLYVCNELEDGICYVIVVHHQSADVSAEGRQFNLETRVEQSFETYNSNTSFSFRSICWTLKRSNPSCRCFSC
jgi:hypothetical protein